MSIWCPLESSCPEKRFLKVFAYKTSDNLLGSSCPNLELHFLASRQWLDQLLPPSTTLLLAMPKNGSALVNFDELKRTQVRNQVCGARNKKFQSVGYGAYDITLSHICS